MSKSGIPRIYTRFVWDELVYVDVNSSLWLGPLAVAAILLGGCNAAALISVLTPTDEMLKEGPIEYGSHERQRLDVYRPRTERRSPRPVVVFFYGGGWTRGDRRDYKFAAEALVSRGYVVVIPDYRLYPEVRFPVFVEDGAAATAWTLANIDRFGGDSARVYVMGHSSGAHIAALLTLDERYLQEANVGDQRLAGMIGLAGPYDFLPLSTSYLKTLFGPAEHYPASQPINFVGGDEPPLLLLHGLDDTVVRLRNTQNLATRVKEAGGAVSVKIYPGTNHVQIVGALARRFRDWAPVIEDVAVFIESNGPSPLLQP